MTTPKKINKNQIISNPRPDFSHIILLDDDDCAEVFKNLEDVLKYLREDSPGLPDEDLLDRLEDGEITAFVARPIKIVGEFEVVKKLKKLKIKEK